MKALTLLKLGGALITDKSKPLTARPERIAQLAQSIAQIYSRLQGQLIIGHGSGSFGHVLVDRHHLRQGLSTQGGEGSEMGLAEALYGVQNLHHLVHRSLVEAGLPTVSLPVHAWVVSTGSVADSAYFAATEQTLHHNMVPLMTGDIVFDTKQGCIVWSTERIFSEIVSHWQKTYPSTKLRAIFVTDVPGVLDSKGEVIPEISHSSYQSITQHLTDSQHIDVTGGMKKKVESGLALAEKGVEVVICGEEALKKCLTNDDFTSIIGTRIII